MNLVFATGNKGKVREASEILGEGYMLYTSAQLGVTEEIPETGSSFRENSMQKAFYLWDRLHADCFADDSGLEIDALGGKPGIYSARYAGDHDFNRNIDKVLKELEGVTDRTARFRCVVTLIMDGEDSTFDGTIEGRIGLERQGDGGFGYDPIFIPDYIPEKGVLVENSRGLSLSQITEEDKNLISHRGEALRAMTEWLERKK